MGSLNIAEWTPEQVAEWMSGLEPAAAQYASGLRARGLDGGKLLTLRCDDLEYLGVRLIGHQELLLEAVDHLRNFQYEVRRECVQRLALHVAVVAGGVARALRGAAGGGGAGGGGGWRLETQTLADVARVVRAVKPLACWLERWPHAAGLRARRAALLALSLEAATCAQRERFAEQPARAVAHSAAATAAAADHIVTDVSDPAVLQPASLDDVALRQRGKPLGFRVVPSFCGHHQLAGIEFGSPAHASRAVHDGDEIVQVNGRCVIGWSGDAVLSLCRAAPGELMLRLRRRGAPPALARVRPRTRHGLTLPRPEAVPPPDPASSSSESEALSPPASPTAGRVRGGAPPRRRHTVCGGAGAPHDLSLTQFWRELRARHWAREPTDADPALYRRDKALSCSTGLELSPRPRTCLGAPRPPPAPPAAPHPPPAPPRRARLDKTQSEPAHEVDEPPAPESPGPPADSPTILVHSAEKADQILDFKKSSCVIGEAILRRECPPEAVNVALVRCAPRARDIRLVRDERRALPPLNGEPLPPPHDHPPHPPHVTPPTHTPGATSRSIFPSAKSRSLKKKNSLLAKRRAVSLAWLSSRGAAGVGAGGRVWQRVRGRGGARWAPRTLLLLHDTLYAYRGGGGARGAKVSRASCMVVLAGWSAAAAPEVRSRQHAFKVYHTGAAFYFACDSRQDMLLAVQTIHRATLHHDPPGDKRLEASRQFSETEYSDTESSEEGGERSDERRDDKDKAKFGSLKKVPRREEGAGTGAGAGAGAASLDRKYLRIFSRHRDKHKRAGVVGGGVSVVPTEQYRSYRRVEPRPPRPLDYLHASNPNLVDAAWTRPAPPPPPPGLLTLEQFMLRKQEEERRQLYSDRVLLGVQRDLILAGQSKALKDKELQKQLARIVPDVIYGELARSASPPALPAPPPPPSAPPSAPPLGPKPISVTGKDGYEKLVYPEDLDVESGATPSSPVAPPVPDKWRDSLRRNDKVHSPPAHHPPPAQGVSRLRLMFGGARAQHRDSASNTQEGVECVVGGQYPHLQCPPTFQPETYSLSARLKPPPAHTHLQHNEQ